MRFAIVTRDELWEAGVLREERLTWGEATTNGDEIVATDTLDEELMSAVPSPRDAGRRWREAPDEGQLTVRVVSSARRVNGSINQETTLIVTVDALSIVTTPEHEASDTALLLKFAARNAERSIDYRGVPIVWRNGSGSVLLHEAAGHPAEQRQSPIAWPEWLSVTDEPAFETDDAGRRTRTSDLLRGEQPSALRRAFFTDVPLPRLSNVVARQNAASFDLPEPRIEVQLVSGGRYESLTDEVVIGVTAADFIGDGGSFALAPFTIHETRAAVARSMRGAWGEPERYPGVICSSEGQEIAVGSHAPLLLTIF